MHRNTSFLIGTSFFHPVIAIFFSSPHLFILATWNALIYDGQYFLPMLY